MNTQKRHDVLNATRWPMYNRKGGLKDTLAYLRVWALQQQGLSIPQIAAYLALPLACIEHWTTLPSSAYDDRRRMKHPNMRLSVEQLRRIPTLLLKEPAAYGLTGEHWSRERISQLIEQEYGVPVSAHYTAQVLKRIKQAIQVQRQEQS